MEIVKHIQENVLDQLLEGPIREGAKLNIFLGNKAGWVTEVFVGCTLEPVIKLFLKYDHLRTFS